MRRSDKSSLVSNADSTTHQDVSNFVPDGTVGSANYAEIGMRVRETRKSLNMSQGELAKVAGTSIHHISCIERGAKNVGLGVLIRLATAMGVTVDRLLSGNQPTDTMAFMPEMQTLMEDCSTQERHILLDIAVAAKDSLRRNTVPYYLKKE